MKIFNCFVPSSSVLAIMLCVGCESTDPNPNIQSPGINPPSLRNAPPVDLTQDPSFENNTINDDDGGPGAFGLPGEDVITDPNNWKLVTEDLGFPIIYFAYDKDVIGSQEQGKLDMVAEYMVNRSNLGLIIEGHCDDRGSAEYNRALGERRAIAVKNYLIVNGVASTRFKTVSFGEDNPAIQGQSLEAYSKNRRGVLLPAMMK